MAPPLWAPFDTLARASLPVMMTIALAVVSALPFRVSALAAIAPALPLVAVCYWTFHRPRLMPAAAAFIVGLLIDVLSGAPLGVNAAVLVLVHLLVRSQRASLAGRSFLIVWPAVSLIIAAALALSWVLVSLYFATLIDPTVLVFETLVSTGCLPPLWWLMRQCQAVVTPRA